MKISFNLPHVFGNGASTVEKQSVLRTLHKYLTKIQNETDWRGGAKPSVSIEGHYAVWNLPHVFKSNANPVDNAKVLRFLLDALTDINVIYLRVRPNTKPLYNAGVRYGRTQLWEPISALYSRGYGDCKSLTAALVAQQRLQGFTSNPVFRFRTRRDNSGNDYHILVHTNSSDWTVNDDGFEDPSKVLGMGQDENAWFRH